MVSHTVPRLKEDMRVTSPRTRPTRKATKINDIKRHLNVATIVSDGLLVAKRNEPFVPANELLIFRRSVLHGLVTSIHLQISRPSANQMKKRFFFALDMNKAIDSFTAACSQCSALKKGKHFSNEQNTSDPPENIGSKFAADDVKQEKQLIIMMWECFSSYTTSLIIENKKTETLRLAIT